MAFKDHGMSELYEYEQKKKRKEWSKKQSEAEKEAVKLLLKKRIAEIKKAFLEKKDKVE